MGWFSRQSPQQRTLELLRPGMNCLWTLYAEARLSGDPEIVAATRAVFDRTKPVLDRAGLAFDEAELRLKIVGEYHPDWDQAFVKEAA